MARKKNRPSDDTKPETSKEEKAGAAAPADGKKKAKAAAPADILASAGSVSAPKTVTVFGAGIAGLTVAHELVERGFLVQVVEAEESLTSEGCCEVGGVAATQWSFLSDPDLPYEAAWKVNWYPPTDLTRPSFEALVPAPALPYRIYFEVVQAAGGGWVRKAYDGAFTIGSKLGVPPTEERTENLDNAKRLDLLAKGIKNFHQTLPQPLPPEDAPRIYVVGHSERTVTEGDARAWSLESANEVVTQLEAILRTDHGLIPGTDLHLTPIAIGSAEPVGDNRFDDGRVRNNRVELHVAGARIPGDHGYRFFPAFYRNLDDTMRRTPLYDFAHDETGESALSRLKGTPDVSIALADGGESLRLPRRRARSFEELRDLTCKMFDKLGYTAKDLALFQLQMFRFATMSPERRGESLDAISWLKYVRGGEGTPDGSTGPECPRCGRSLCHDHVLPFSKRFLRDLDKLPQAMSGMRARESDAHTNGIVSLQMMLDQLGDGTSVDRLLDGPTSTSWLSHWKSYLRRQGVRFFLGRLVGLEPEYDGSKVVGLKPIALGLRRNDYKVIYIPLPGGLAPIYITVPPRIDPVPEPSFTDEVSLRQSLVPSKDYKYEPSADYYVAALPVDQLRTMLRAALPTYNDLEEPLKAIRKFRVGSAFAPGRDGPPADDVPFRDVTGVQFYFANHFHLADGHMYHADSAWRLTSVTQLQFWRQRRTVNSGYLGIMSIDIGEMHEGDTSLCTKLQLQLASAIETIGELARENSNGGLKSLLDRLLVVQRHMRGLESSLSHWVSHLPRKSPPAPALPWDVTAQLKVEIEGKITDLINGAQAGRNGLGAVLVKLGAGLFPTPAEMANLKWTIDQVVTTSPPSLQGEGAAVWNFWKSGLEGLKDVVDTLNAADIAVQAPWAARAMRLAAGCLKSLSVIPFAWQSTSDEIARVVWRQIEVSLHEHLRGSMPEPNYYHLDRGIEFDRVVAGRRLPSRNGNPFFINAVDGFASRPGVLPGTKATPFYKIAYGQWLPVGGVMKSHTRITSMEHANESGRHAVRAILHDLVTKANGEMHGTMPKWWNPENHELPDLEFLRRVDAVLYEDGHPHLVDILGLEEAVVRWLPGEGAESADNLGNLLSAVRYQSDRDFAPWIEAMEKSSEPVRKLIEFISQIGMRSSVK